MMVVSRARLWGGVLAATALAAIGCWSVGQRFTFDMSIRHMTVTAFTIAMMLTRHRYEHSTIRRAIDSLELLLLFATISVAGALASFVIVATDSGYVDAQLAAADRLLGFDWPALYRFMAERPLVNAIGTGCYLSIFLSPTVILLHLAWTDRTDRARSFLATFAIALLITVCLFHWFPARGAQAFYGDRFRDLSAIGVKQVAAILSLRSAKPDVMDITMLPGIVSFPSFHAACAIMFVWAAWPSKPLRLLMLPLNIGMAMATPIEGSHYIVDLFGGFAVAAIAIALPSLARHRFAIGSRETVSVRSGDVAVPAA